MYNFVLFILLPTGSSMVDYSPLVQESYQRLKNW